MQCMPETPERQLEGFVAKFEPATGKLIRASRTIMRKRFPTANELVYDNYNFFVIGYCTTERPSDCVVSLCRKFQGDWPQLLPRATLPIRTISCKAAGIRIDSSDSLTRAASATRRFWSCLMPRGSS